MTGRLRIAIAGVGRWGKNLARVFSEAPRARLVALCDTDADRLSSASLPRDARRTLDLDDLLESDDVEAIVIATPPETHAPIARRALSASKHVFVEKPMALSTADANELRKVAHERDRRLMVGHVLLYHPAVAELSTRLRMGDLGVLRTIHCVRTTASRRLPRESAWWSLAPHDVSLLLRLFGARPREVAAQSCSAATGEAVTAQLGFPGGCAATIQVGVDQATDVRQMLVVGTKRTALFDDRAPVEKLKFFDICRDGWTRAAPSLANLPHYYDAPELPAHEPLAVEARHFIEAILDGRPIASDAVEGCGVIAALEAGDRSLAQGGAPATVEGNGLPRHRHFFAGGVSVSARSRS